MSALGDIIVDALKQLLRVLFTPIEKLIETYAPKLLKTVVGTPHPDSVFSRPTNEVWPGIYDYYWEAIIPLALLLWALSVGLVIFFESTSYLFSSYHRSKLKKRAFSGLLGILMWWWIAALSLRLMEALTGFLLPDLSEISLFETLSFSALGALGVVIAMATDLVLFVLIAILYFMRYVVLYLFVLLMPLLIAFWIPGVGPFALVSGFVKRLAGFYVPFLFMVLPVALLFRLGELLGDAITRDLNGIMLWLTALVIPIVAVVSPFILFWQAGALFFTLDRASQRVSGQRAQARATQAKAIGESGTHHSRNFGRGIRGQSAVQRDGTVAFGSGDSRTNSAGLRLRSAARETSGSIKSRFPTSHNSVEEDRTESFDILRRRDGGSPPGQRGPVRGSEEPDQSAQRGHNQRSQRENSSRDDSQ